MGSFREKQLLAFGDWLLAGWNWVCFAFFGLGRFGGDAEFEIFGLERYVAVDWARFAPLSLSLPVFGIALSAIMRGIIPESLVDVKY